MTNYSAYLSLVFISVHNINKIMKDKEHTLEHFTKYTI